MKFIFHCRLLALLIIGLVWGGGRAQASPTNFVGFALSAYNTTNSPLFTNSLITTVITVTNDTGLTLSTLYITNDFSAAVAFETFTNYGTNVYFTTNSIVTNDTSAIILFQILTKQGVVQMTVTWQPLEAGLITNTITVGTPDLTNNASTNLVSNIYGGEADLGVSLAYVAQAFITNAVVITNDWVTYRLTVTNAGPDAAAGVQLTNTLPASVILLSPGNPTIVSNNVVYNVGALASGAAAQYEFAIQPTNTGAYPLTASVGTSDLYDPNPANNVVTHVLLATNILATLTVGTNSGQNLNFQNGLVEQTILVSNTSGTNVPAVRVVVTGLTNDLFNAGGTNAGHPFVTYPAGLAAGGAAGLRLQYFPRPASLPFPFTNGQLHAYAVPAAVLNYTPFPAAQFSTNVNISRIVRQADGDMLIEFPAVLGDAYTIVYSDNVLFTNARIAPPAYIAPGNRVQWLDYGPPATVSAPTNSSQRFYRVYLNP
jgi:uncharacterized repeat protein (TIGR01451 family)